MSRLNPPIQGKREGAQQKEKKQQSQVTAREALNGIKKKEKKKLYSEALGQFVPISLGISNLEGTQHFTGQHPEKPNLTVKSIQSCSK